MTSDAERAFNDILAIYEDFSRRLGARWYILDAENRPVEEHDLMAWARWMHGRNRTVARTRVGRADVSTVFLGMDHRLLGKGPPILFETMVFGVPEYGDLQQRYSSWDDALTGHRALVRKLRKTK